jgi:hypothetical protein
MTRDPDDFDDVDFGMMGASVPKPVLPAPRPNPRAESFAAYQAIRAVNYSSLRNLHVASSPLVMSPLRYRHFQTHTRPETDAMLVGRAGHTAVFEPDRFPLEYVVWSHGRRQGPRWTNFKAFAAADGKTVLTEAQYETAIAIRDAVRGNALAMWYLDRGDPEKTLTWTDPVTRLRCKGRLDWFSRSHPCVVDLKTARDIDARMFGASAARMGYHRQLAMYANGAVANELLVDPRAVIIAVENAPPHEVAVYALDADALAAGAEEVAALLACLKTCIETNRWPGRYEKEQTLELPSWLFDEDDGPEALENAGFRLASGE